jgi:hypothetical protein
MAHRDEPDRTRLDDVEEEIHQARRQAADDLTPPDDPAYFESGTVGEEQDDQTITPPG